MRADKARRLEAQKAAKNQRAVYGMLHNNVPIMDSWMRKRGLWVAKDSWPYENWPSYISGPCTFMDKEAALGKRVEKIFLGQVLL